MKLALSELKLTSPRVRQSQDPEKLDELAASIGAFGQAIIPIGVRKNGSGYAVIYGHRRVAAAKQAGLKEIDAIEVDAGDDMLKVFGLVENVVREDMGDAEIGKVLLQIKAESGWSNAKVATFLGQTETWVEWKIGVASPEVLKAIGTVGDGHGHDFTSRHLKEVKAGLGEQHRGQMPAVIKKIVAEGLNTNQARHVADMVAGAREQDGQRGANAILSKPYEDMRPTVPPGHQSLMHKTEWGKPKAQDWKGMAKAVDASLRILADMTIRLASSKDGKAVVKKLVPKWIGELKRVTKTLEGIR